MPIKICIWIAWVLMMAFYWQFVYLKDKVRILSERLDEMEKKVRKLERAERKAGC